VRPGLSGVGSVLFRDEESIIARVPDPVRFDDEVITPYKGQLERWYVCNQSLGHYLDLIATTLLVVIFPERGFHRRLLARVPAPPPELQGLL
jgi:lipopolysaccharide/colanic/teichoic acid biosynthesis glycosyltransferase